MRVVRLNPDFSYAMLDSQDARFGAVFSRPLAATSVASTWAPGKFVFSDPELPRGDFNAITAEMYAFRHSVANRFRTLMEQDGELLPIEVVGEIEPYYIWNVTEVSDVVDHDKCVREMFPGNIPGRILKYAFRREALISGQVFKADGIPKTVLLATSSDGASPSRDFVAAYEAADCTGIAFELLWSD